MREHKGHDRGTAEAHYLYCTEASRGENAIDLSSRIRAIKDRLSPQQALRRDLRLGHRREDRATIRLEFGPLQAS